MANFSNSDYYFDEIKKKMIECTSKKQITKSEINAIAEEILLYERSLMGSINSDEELMHIAQRIGTEFYENETIREYQNILYGKLQEKYEQMHKNNQQEVNPKDANYYFDGIVSLYQDLAINIDNYSDEQAKDVNEQLKSNSLLMFSLIKSDDELRQIIT